MDASEAAQALALCASYDNRTVTASAALAWAEALDDVTLPDAKAAVIRHYKASREWVMPYDIREGAKVLRRERLDAAERDGALLLEPPATDSDAAMRAWAYAYRRALGDGHTPDQADLMACQTAGLTRSTAALEAKPIGYLVSQLADALPKVPTHD